MINKDRNLSDNKTDIIAIPLEFWKSHNLIFQVDKTNYYTQEDINNQKDLAKFYNDLVKKHEYQQCEEFENKELWFLLKFFYISSKFHHSDAKGISVAIGGVPKRLKIKCECGKLLEGKLWLTSYCKPPFARFNPSENLMDHEYYFRVSEQCPLCNKIVCIYRPKENLLKLLMIFLNFLVPSEDNDLFKGSILFQWIALVDRVLVSDMTNILTYFSEDLKRVMDLIDRHPEIDENTKKTIKSTLQLSNRLRK